MDNDPTSNQSPNNTNIRQDIHGVPAVSIQHNRLVVGDANSTSLRSYTSIKQLGDGSFGTVWLCDWHGALPPDTPLSPMQCGDGARPEWVGKRLVAVKRMKKRWQGGWDECKQLKELESLREIPFHPNIIPLYDFFLLPSSKELYFVFESMEGNLFHLIKTRRGRPLAGGLVSSIFRQIVSGIHHIHSSGYFHRDMKPENVLVTTTGLFDYTTLSPVAPPNPPKEKDVVCIIKLADFGLARETKSLPPYTEYVSTRWYRAPEVLLLSKDYSNPVDMWALGTIMAELVNLRPLFPGSNHLDQVTRICHILGDPTDAYGLDAHKGQIGGGAWLRGIRLGEKVGYRFPPTRPKDIHDLFDRTVPLSLVHCIRDLLRYDPDRRLTSQECLQHPYLLETVPKNNVPFPKGIHLDPLPGLQDPPPQPKAPQQNGTSPAIALPTRSSSHHRHAAPQPIPDGIPSHRPVIYAPDVVQFGKGARPQENGQRDAEHEPMDLSPKECTNGAASAIGQDQLPPDPSHNQGNKLFGSFKRSKWGIFGGDKSQSPVLPRVDEGLPSVRPPKRPQSSSSDNMTVFETNPEPPPRDIKKMNKKEAEKLQKDAEMQRRRLALQTQREQARAVMQKRTQITQKSTSELEWDHGRSWLNSDVSDSGHPQKQHGAAPTSAGGVRRGQGKSTHSPHLDSMGSDEWRGISERALKARRLEWDEESSSDVHSIGRASSISFASVDSDPGPSRVRNRPNLFNLPRMQSTSSLRTSIDEFPPSARSSNSFSLEGQLAHDFRVRATMEPYHSPLARDHSPSPSLSPSISPPPWGTSPLVASERLGARREAARSPPYDAGFEFNPQLQTHPPSPNFMMKPAINPIFKVPPYIDDMASIPSLPPFSQLEAVAGTEYPPIVLTQDFPHAI